MNGLKVIAAAAGVVIYSIAMVFLGMAVATKYNRQAWDKFYEGRGDR